MRRTTRALAGGMFALLALQVFAYLPDEGKPAAPPKPVAGPGRKLPPAGPRPASAASTPVAPTGPDAGSAAEDLQRQSLEKCLAEMNTLRRLVADKCVMSGSVCYLKQACTLQDDGRYQCAAIDELLTSRYKKAQGNPCS